MNQQKQVFTNHRILKMSYSSILPKRYETKLDTENAALNLCYFRKPAGNIRTRSKVNHDCDEYYHSQDKTRPALFS